MGVLIIWVIFLAILAYWMMTKKPFLRKKRYINIVSKEWKETKKSIKSEKE